MCPSKNGIVGGRPYFTPKERLDAFEQLMPLRFRQSGLSISRARRTKPDLGLTLPNARRDFCLASLTLIGADPYNAWCDDRYVQAAAEPPGGLMIVDQRLGWITDIRKPIASVHLFVPLGSLNELTGEAHAPRIETLVCPIEAPQLDEVMLHLTRALLPALSRPHEATTLFVDHLLRAMLVHLAQTYGGVRLTLEIPRGGLMPWQERRAKEMLLENVRGELPLTDLAEACGLAVRQFSRAFKWVTGSGCCGSASSSSKNDWPPPMTLWEQSP